MVTMEEAGSFLLKWFVAACAGYATVMLIFRIGSRDEHWTLNVCLRLKELLASACIFNALGIAVLRQTCILADVLLGCAAGSLIAASVMDLWERMVYRFVWCLASGALAGVWFLQNCQGKPAGAAGWQLLLYIFVQQAVFGRFYGRADCHAFCVCALGMTVLGMEWEDFTAHMTIAFAGLCAMQFLSGNVTRRGRLKKPVPFIPYIVAAFWLWVDFAIGKWYI